MELQSATRIFQALGSERRLAIYLQVASSPRGLPVAELTKRCGLPEEALLIGVSELVGAGLVRRVGSGALTWYTASPRALEEALGFAVGPDTYV